MKAKCPRCGHEFPVRSRRAVGEGDVRGEDLKRLNRNKINVGQVLSEISPRGLTVREVQKILFDKEIRRWRRGDRDYPSGGWNYHNVQAELSLLVGAEILMMSSAEQYFHKGLQEHTTDRVPRYWMAGSQKDFFEDVVRRNGWLSF